jgi:hypothetical protein
MNPYSPRWSFQLPNILNLKSTSYGLAFRGYAGCEFTFT